MQNYRIDKWSIEELNDFQAAKSLIIPTFQRAYVWDSKRKREFIDSLRKGYPFGTLLVYQQGDRYTIIDGLQRTTTIIDYFSQPKKYFSKDGLLDPAILHELAECYDSSDDIIGEEIEKWFLNSSIEKIGDFSDHSKFGELGLLRFLNEEMKVEQLGEAKEKKIDHCLSAILNDIQNGYKIENSDVPILVYYGPKETLPEVFKRLNRQGKPLTTYEILGATLSDKGVALPDDLISKKIKKKIDERVESYRKLGYVYETQNGDDEIVDEDAVINPFQYLYGLGKVLSEEFPSLFGESDANDFDVETFAFNLVCYCFKKDVVVMDKVIEEHIVGADSLAIKKLHEGIFEAAKNIHITLRPYIDFFLNSNRKTSRFLPPHSDYQIVAYVAGMFHVLQDNLDTLESYKNSVRSNYVYDILTEKWSGTGNRRALEWVMNPKAPVDQKEWGRVLDLWLNEQNGRKDKKRSGQTREAVLILQYLYSRILTHEDAQNDVVYELDHLVPVKRLTGLIKDGEEGLAINSIANIALIPSRSNRVKRDRTIYEIDGITPDEICELERYTFTTADELGFAVKGSKQMTRGEYHKFLLARSIKIKSKFLEMLGRWDTE